jgi:hypothetical protein
MSTSDLNETSNAAPPSFRRVLIVVMVRVNPHGAFSPISQIIIQLSRVSQELASRR